MHAFYTIKRSRREATLSWCEMVRPSNYQPMALALQVLSPQPLALVPEDVRMIIFDVMYFFIREYQSIV